MDPRTVALSNVSSAHSSSSVGVFTRAHAGPEAFDELVRMVRPVGVIAFALWTDLYEEVGFEAKQDELERRGELEAYRALGAFRREP